MSVSNSVLRYAKLKQFFDLFVGRKRLDCAAERLLEKIMLNWDEGLIVSTDDLIFSSGEIATRSILSKQLEELVTLGFIELHPSKADASIKIPSPTVGTIKYYQDLAQYLEKCFAANSPTDDLAALMVDSNILSQDYLKAQSHALSAYTMAVA